MDLSWKDACGFVLTEHKNNVSKVLPSRRMHYFSKNMPVFDHSMQQHDVLITMAWTLETLRYIEHTKQIHPNNFLLKKCRKNLADLLCCKKVLRNPDFKIKALELLGQIYTTEGDFLRAEWHFSRISDANNNSKFALTFNKAPTTHQQNSLEEYLLNGEPYLAWQFLKLNPQHIIDPMDSFSITENFLYSIFAPCEDVKRLLRQKTANTNSDIPLCFLVLLARGELDWIEDSSLLTLISRNKTEMTPLIVNLVKAFQKNQIHNEIESLLMVLEDIYVNSQTSHPLISLFIYASLLRALLEHGENQLISLLNQRFQSVNLHLSQNKFTDLFKLFAGKTDAHPVEKENMSCLPLQQIPHGLLKRGQAELTLTYEISKILGPRRFTFFLSGKRNKIHLKDEEVKEILHAVSLKMSELKGPLMKIGQTLSYTQTSLPANIASVFSQLPDSSLPLNITTVLEQVKKSAPAELLKDIRLIEPAPIGIGSIGQVHKCHLNSGEIVAIKVKYPEIENIVEADFRLLKLVAKTFALINPRFPLMPFIKTLEKNMLRECNYLLEAESMERFSKRFLHDPEIVIPKVYKNYSSRDILVTTFEQGSKFNEITDADTAQKEFWAKSLVRFVVSSCRDGDFNTDPHPGNFLFRENKLVCLDFGSINQWQPATIKAWNLLILACVEQNENYLDLAMETTLAHTKYSHAKLGDLLKTLTLDGQDGFWTANNSSVISPKNLSKQLNKLIKIQSYFRMPSEIIFGMRVYFGHLSIVSLLGVQYNWNQLVKEIMTPWKEENQILE